MLIRSYADWLDLPPSGYPYHHYDLLDLPRFCSDQGRIEKAARARMAKVRVYQAHPDRESRETCQRIIREIASARVCLISPQKKAEYDQELARQLGVDPPATERSRTDRYGEALAGLDSAEQRARADAFRELTTAHLLRWQLSEDEQELLTAEAEAYGIPPDQARRIIVEVNDAIEAEVRRTRKITRWTIGLGVAAVLLCVVAYASHELTDYLRLRMANMAVSSAKAMVADHEWDAARRSVRRARELDPYRPQRYDGLELEISNAECDALLTAAHRALTQNDWPGFHARIDEAEKVNPNRPETADVRRQGFEKAAGAIRKLLIESRAATEQRRWHRAEELIDQAAVLADTARVPPDVFRVEREPLKEAVGAAERADWERLENNFRESYSAWDLALARKVVSEARRIHPAEQQVTDRWTQKIEERADYIEQLDRRLDGLSRAGSFAEAHRLIAECRLPANLCEPRIAQIDEAWRDEADSIARRVLELSEQARRPSISIGACSILKAESTLPSTIESLDIVARRAQAALRQTGTSDEHEITLVRIQRKEDAVVIGEIVEQDSARICYRPVVQENPLTLGWAIDEISTLEVSDQRELRTLSLKESGEVRSRMLQSELQATVASENHLRTLEIIGELQTMGVPLPTAAVPAERLSLMRSVDEAANYCPACAGAGGIPCDHCGGQGKVDGTVMCDRCGGSGSYYCRTCDGRGTIRCTACENGRIRKRVGIGPRSDQNSYEWVDCPHCRGGWKDCPNCERVRELFTCTKCDGARHIQARVTCSYCNGEKTVACPECRGTGRRRR